MTEVSERIAIVETHVDAMLKSIDKHIEDCRELRLEHNKRFIRLEKTIWVATGAVIVVVAGLRLLLGIH